LKKILITGGSGLLATNIAVAIRDKYSVALCLNEKIIRIDDTEAIQLNIADYTQLSSSISSIKPSVIIHSAGLTSVEKCEESPQLAEHINVDITDNIARVCNENNILLIYISTDHLFSGDEAFIDERHPVNPKNVYGKTKAQAESRVLDKCENSIVIRTNFFGWGTSYRNSFSDIVLNSLKNNETIKLFQDVFYTPILIEEFVTFLVKLIGKPKEGIFNIVSSERISKYDFGMMLARQFKYDEKLIIAGNLSGNPGLIQRPLDMSLSNKKICEYLGMNPDSIKKQIERLQEQESLKQYQEIRKL
jgi:dTDP-4-dehydrorhamnose reductase